MLNKITDLKVVDQYGLSVVFSGGTSCIFDASNVLREQAGPLARSLLDPVYFARVFLEFGAPTWPNGYDMCPDWLHLELEKTGELSRSVAAE